jgi:hypothetical protein
MLQSKRFMKTEFILIRFNRPANKTYRKPYIPVPKLETRGNVQSFRFAGYSVSRQRVNSKSQQNKI